jgi:hypothetical protein
MNDTEQKLYKGYYCESRYQICEVDNEGKFLSLLVERGNHRWLEDMYISPHDPEAADLDEMMMLGNGFISGGCGEERQGNWR